MSPVAGAPELESAPSLDLAIRRAKGYVALTKPRIIELLLITTMPTMFVAAKHLPSFGLIALTLIGGSLAAGGANAMNMVYDRDIDALMERTKHRPLVTGLISPRSALVFAIGLEIGAFVELWLTVNLLSAILAVSATAFYVLIYTMWLKRSTTQNIVIGGAAGAVPVLVGWSSVTGRVGIAPIILFGIVFFWTPPHFWALAVRYRDDYRSASVPMLPAVADLSSVVKQIIWYTVVLDLLVISFGFVAPYARIEKIVYFFIALALGGAFLWKSLSLRKDASPKNAMSLFTFSITYLTVLFVAMGLIAAIQHP
ncbi:MAG TPA: heme o synthase [Acidimicrobiales bacterium]|nr:heme o synthase [Acidimicrobiales bacterium]